MYGSPSKIACGVPASIVEIFIDVTVIKRAEAALVRAQEIEQASLQVLVKDSRAVARQPAVAGLIASLTCAGAGHG